MNQVWSGRDYTGRPAHPRGRTAAGTTAALTIVKMAVFAPIPSASTRIATTVNPGAFVNVRKAYARSCRRQCHTVALRTRCGECSMPGTDSSPRVSCLFARA